MHLPGPTYTLSPFSPGVRGMVMYQKTRKIAWICRQREREGGRKRERARSPRKRFPLWGNKGRAIRTSSFHPSSRRNRKIAGHRTLHLIIFALFHTFTFTYTYIHTYTPQRALREISLHTRDWLTYVCVYVCVCVSASLPLSPPRRPLTQNRAIIQKSKKTTSPFLLVHNLYTDLNDHK